LTENLEYKGFEPATVKGAIRRLGGRVPWRTRNYIPPGRGWEYVAVRRQWLLITGSGIHPMTSTMLEAEAADR
jgi:hypothetical protein